MGVEIVLNNTQLGESIRIHDPLNVGNLDRPVAAHSVTGMPPLLFESRPVAMQLRLLVRCVRNDKGLQISISSESRSGGSTSGGVTAGYNRRHDGHTGHMSGFFRACSVIFISTARVSASIRTRACPKSMSIMPARCPFDRRRAGVRRTIGSASETFIRK